jgi:hypothetical protein
LNQTIGGVTLECNSEEFAEYESDTADIIRVEIEYQSENEVIISKYWNEKFNWNSKVLTYPEIEPLLNEIPKLKFFEENIVEHGFNIWIYANYKPGENSDEDEFDVMAICHIDPKTKEIISPGISCEMPEGSQDKVLCGEYSPRLLFKIPDSEIEIDPPIYLFDSQINVIELRPWDCPGILDALAMDLNLIEYATPWLVVEAFTHMLTVHTHKPLQSFSKEQLEKIPAAGMEVLIDTELEQDPVKRKKKIEERYVEMRKKLIEDVYSKITEIADRGLEGLSYNQFKYTFIPDEKQILVPDIKKGELSEKSWRIIGKSLSAIKKCPHYDACFYLKYGQKSPI